MIRLTEVEKLYRTDKVETLALSSINLDVPEGEFISVMGPSGSGKSTLLNVIGGLDQPTEGTVSLNDREITSYKDRHVARIRNEEVGNGIPIEVGDDDLSGVLHGRNRAREGVGRRQRQASLPIVEEDLQPVAQRGLKSHVRADDVLEAIAVDVRGRQEWLEVAGAT